MKRLLTYLALILLNLLSTLSFGQKMEARLSLSGEEISIGEQIEVHVEIRFNINDQVQFPLLKDTLTAHLEIVTADKIDTTYEGSDLTTKVLSQRLVITSFDTGYQMLPPIVFKSDKDSTRTEPFLIRVNDVPVEMPQAENQEIEIKDIKDIQEIPFSFWEWFKQNYYWFILFYFIVMSVLAYIYHIRPNMKKKVKTEIKIEPKIPPHELALAQLASLKAKNLWQQGRVKEFHIELSDIIRNYIEIRFDVPALESTTFEIIAALKNIQLSESSIEKLKASLELADLVKFAKFNPLPDENATCYEAGVQFIHDTKPTPIVETSEHV